MFVPRIIRRSRNDQHYALTCTIPLFHILAPTCFGSTLLSSGGFLDPSELLETQIEWVVYHIMCGYVTCVQDCRGSVRNHDNPAHRRKTKKYRIHYFQCRTSLTFMLGLPCVMNYMYNNQIDALFYS
jgi:hypothetical protein